MSSMKKNRVIFIDDLMDIFNVGDDSCPSFFNRAFNNQLKGYEYELYTIETSSCKDKGAFILFDNNLDKPVKKFENCESFCGLIKEIDFKDAYVYIDYSLNGNQCLLHHDNDCKKVIDTILKAEKNLPKSLSIYSAIRPGDAKELAKDLNEKVKKFPINYTCFSNSKYFAEEYFEDEFKYLKSDSKIKK